MLGMEIVGKLLSSKGGATGDAKDKKPDPDEKPDDKQVSPSPILRTICISTKYVLH